MAARTAKRAGMAYGRWLRGTAKGRRSGLTPRKRRRRSWRQAPGEDSRKRVCVQKLTPPLEGRKVYGPFGGGAS